MIKRLLTIFPAIALLGVGLYFIVTTVPAIRYWADDFCSATVLRNSGYFGAQLSWWKSWTGRYSFIAVLDLFESLGKWSVQFTPLVLLSLLILTLAPVLGFLLASLFIILALMNAPNIIQSFYWQMGSINYTFSFILLNVFLSLLLLKKTKYSLAVALLLTFVAAGFSESFAITQGVLLFFILLLLLLVRPKEKAQKIRIVIVGVVGTVLSLAVMLFSPGNAIREASVTHPESIMFVIKSTILATKWYMLRMMSIKPFVYSLVILFSSVYVIDKKIILSQKKALYVMLITVLAAIFSAIAVIGSGYYSMSIIPPERTLFIAIYMMLLCFLVFSFGLKTLLTEWLPVRLKNWFLWAVIILNLAASILLIKSIAPHLGSVRAEIQAYANALDKIEPKLVESSGKEELTIKNIKPVGELDSFTDNKGWVATCLGQYYKIGNIKISP